VKKSFKTGENTGKKSFFPTGGNNRVDFHYRFKPKNKYENLLNDLNIHNLSK